MEITYLAHSCFEIKNDNLTLLIDPFEDKIGYKMPKQQCDVLLVSHGHYDHANKSGVTGYRLLIETPGEYEVAGVSIMGLPTFHDATEGSERGKNNIYVIEIDGINIMHLGDLGHELSKDTLEKLPEIDVLMIPVGGIYTIDAKVASKVISSIEPGIVIPMHYQTAKLTVDENLAGVDKFLEEMGVETPKNSNKLKLSKRSDIPEETEVLVLNPTA